MSRSVVHGCLLAAGGICLAFLILELGVRIHRATVLDFRSLVLKPSVRVRRMTRDLRFGWIPRPGRYTNAGWTSNVDEFGIRSNGRAVSPAGPPILAVGDSFTFGNEVEDGETWPAQLEKILNKRVLNAGASGYGVDQAFLRAEALLGTYDPDVVILSLISDDIDRTEYSYYQYSQGWKPYFEYQNGSLFLRNIPVGELPAPHGSHRFEYVRRLMGYSRVADIVFDTIARRWWLDLPVNEKVHDDGDEVSVDLLARLDELTRRARGRFVAVALATSGRIGSNARLPNLVKRSRDRGVEVLDLSIELLNRPPGRPENWFRPGGHYTPAMNRWVATRIAEFLRGMESRSSSDGRPSG